MRLLRRKDGVKTLDVLSMLMESYQLIHIRSDVDDISKQELQHDWESLRNDLSPTTVLRHSTLSAQMPSESSSVVSNATNGIEPPRDTCPLKNQRKDLLSKLFPPMLV